MFTNDREIVEFIASKMDRIVHKLSVVMNHAVQGKSYLELLLPKVGVETVDENGWGWIHHAVAKKNLSITDYLLSRNCPLIPNGAVSPMILALLKNDVSIHHHQY